MNSLKNLISGIGGQILTLLLQFVSRTVFISSLGVAYLGISGLFTNVLSILSITELGIGTAIIYSLYKPLASENKDRIKSIMQLYKKAYFLVGLFIMIVGLMLIPFLPNIMKGTTNLVNINLIYVMYLFQTVSSYWFFAYKSSMLQADQKLYQVNIVTYIVKFISTIIQIIGLIIFHSFILYTVVGLLSNIIKNIIIARIVDRTYPYLRESDIIPLHKEERNDIFKNLFGMSMYKINSVIVRSTDNIVISTFINVSMVGYYSNYHLISNSIMVIIKILFASFTSSIGQLYAIEDKKKSEFIFRCLNVLNHWIFGFTSISLYFLFNPFIELWLGKEYTFSTIVVLIIVIDYLLDGFQSVSITYKDACGLFWQGRYRPVFTAILNIIISVWLAPILGITGVLLGTIISRLLTTWWFEPWMVYKYAFKISSKTYFINYFISLVLLLASAFMIYAITNTLVLSTIYDLVIKMILCLMIPNILFYYRYRKTEEFNYIKKSLFYVIQRMTKKMKREVNNEN